MKKLFLLSILLIFSCDNKDSADELKEKESSYGVFNLFYSYGYLKNFSSWYITNEERRWYAPSCAGAVQGLELGDHSFSIDTLYFDFVQTGLIDI